MQSGAQMERIAMVILSHGCESEKGNVYILVVVDYFTKWVEAFAISDQESNLPIRETSAIMTRSYSGRHLK